MLNNDWQGKFRPATHFADTPPTEFPLWWGGGGGEREEKEGEKEKEGEREREMFYLVTLSTAKIIQLRW